MYARITISPISASFCTRPSNCSRVSWMSSPGSLTRARVSERRPRSRLISPVSLPGPCMTTSVSPRLDGRMISISPLFTTKNGTTESPASMRISPRETARLTPCAAMRSKAAAVDGRRSHGSGANEWRVDDVFRDEPHLQFVSPDDVADQQIIGPIVARLGGATSHRAGFLDQDFVRVKQTRDLDRRLFAPAGRPRDERRLGDVVRHRDADTAEQLDTFRDRIDELVLLAGVLVEEQMELVEARTRNLPMVLLVEVAQRDRVGEDLVEIFDRLFAGSLRKRDRHSDNMSVRLHLRRGLMRLRRRFFHDHVGIKRLHTQVLSVVKPFAISFFL